ncbi:hypothetical protein HYALB_00012453 [Hymenoscyphus albidus]|uniref:VWFA domain-containing protein n=1 Tax=Hymenoscyphus albidus TaxID=595503 RepID=A0A9N9LUN2_9HELO|nr:hypothetical protein HYALB_00012453 [Hymenoscyphus albidus]
MSFHWNEVQNTLEALTYILKGVVPDGIDISLATSKQQLNGIRSTTKLLRFLDQQNAKFLLEKRMMDINSSISPILRKHTNAMREWTKSGSTKSPRSITLYILTDGIWKGDESIDINLDLLERDLNHFKYGDPNSGVQFITFGDDPVGSSHLDRLDNELRGYNIDVTPCRGNIRKMLFGVGGSQGSEQKDRSKNRLPALKNGIRRISTTLSIKSGSGEANAEKNLATNRAAALQLKPRNRRLVQGLFELTNPPQPTLDALFVHGLDGDREKDWVVRNRNTSTQINWPKDLMYQRFRDVRILTYGNDSAPWHSSYPIKDVITSQARVLLESLVKVREHTPGRPLILVAQGTGSLLTKSALLQSHLSLDADATKEKAIKLSTTGLVLLDPPDLQISGESIVPAILESHVVGEW